MIQWAYGVMTVPQRVEDLLPRTLASLKLAGFEKPRLFIDGAYATGQEYRSLGLEFTIHWPKVKVAGNWFLSLAEMYIRRTDVDYYALFQDDFVTYRNLRQYLERTRFPSDGYFNLYSFPQNESLAPEGKTGWHLSNQNGRGAVALIFDQVTVTTLLRSEYMIERFKDCDKGTRSIDGGVTMALRGIRKEYVHNPSLVQHTGMLSTMQHGPFPQSESFRGEEFDALSLIK